MPSAGDVRAGGAFVELYAKSGKLIGGLDRASKRLREFSARAASLSRKVAAVGAAIQAPLIAAAKHFADFGDDIHKMSARTGIGAEALTELRYAAEQSGTNLKTVGDAVFRMTRRIANASKGTGPAVRALKEMGLNAEELNKLSPEEQFLTIADELSKMENETLAAQYGFEILGDSFKQLKPLVDEGREGIEALRKRAQELGITMSDEDAQAAADLTDRMSDFSKQMQAVILHIGAAVAGPLTKLLDRIIRITAVIVSWVKENRDLFATILKVSAAVMAVAGLIASVAIAGLMASAVLAGLGTVFVALKTLLLSVAQLLLSVAQLLLFFPDLFWQLVL